MEQQEEGQDASSVQKKVKHNEEVLAKDLGNSSNVAGLTSGSLDSDNSNGSNSEMSYHDNGNEEDDAVEDYDEDTDYDDNDDFLYEDKDYDDYLSMQAQFDNVDLPPGVEAPVSWLEDPMPNSSTSTLMLNVSSQSNFLVPQVGAGSSVPLCLDPNSSEHNAAASSSSTISSELASTGKEIEETDEEVMRKYEGFKQFDIVDDFSDHHFIRAGFIGQEPPRNWTKKIQDEWKILEKDLPDTIYVRVNEKRMDLLRAVIVGPQGTPYHDGLFVFDVLFPPTYPDIPPMVYYYSGGLRLNPNLYDCGKVCLSLLNTWTGQGSEKWIPKKSTMLQVLVSIQALILNAKPFFNEPGYENTYRGAEGERKSKAYNEDVYILSLKTMMYTLRRPPKHLEDFVTWHFRLHAHDILSACKAYMEGAPIGYVVKGKVPDGTIVDRNLSQEFKVAAGRMMNSLISNFTKKGAKDCEQFRPSG